jgi:8-oxo-dGTP diphosphatase
MSVAINRQGDILLTFDRAAERDAARFQPLTHALIVVKHADSYLLAWNNFRQEWEIAGGVIDPGDTPRECVSRELFEETGQTTESIRFCGVMKLQLQPDNRIEYGALFAGDLDELKPFTPNHEIGRIILWDQKTDIGYINEIDAAYLELA